MLFVLLSIPSIKIPVIRSITVKRGRIFGCYEEEVCLSRVICLAHAPETEAMWFSLGYPSQLLYHKFLSTRSTKFEWGRASLQDVRLSGLIFVFRGWHVSLEVLKQPYSFQHMLLSILSICTEDFSIIRWQHSILRHCDRCCEKLLPVLRPFSQCSHPIHLNPPLQEIPKYSLEVVEIRGDKRYHHTEVSPPHLLVSRNSIGFEAVLSSQNFLPLLQTSNSVYSVDGGRETGYPWVLARGATHGGYVTQVC